MFGKEKNRYDLERMLKNFELKVESINLGNGDSENDDSADLGREPSKKPKYGKFSKRQLILHDQWPSALECGAYIANPPKWNEYPTVFLSPENKGFE